MAFFKNTIILFVFAPKFSILSTVFKFSSSKEKKALRCLSQMAPKFVSLIHSSDLLLFLDPTFYPSLQSH